MLTDKELIENSKELYKKLGGVGNADARIVRGLWERLEGSKNTEQQVRPDKSAKCVFPDNYIICGAYDGNGNCKSPKGTCRSI